MTAIGGYVAPEATPDEFGIHSLDQFVLAVPDASVAQDFYGSFGLDVVRTATRWRSRPLAMTIVGVRLSRASRRRRCIISRSVVTPKISIALRRGSKATASNWSIRRRVSRATASGSAITKAC